MTDQIPSEPPNDTQLVVTEPDGDTYVICRDDDLATIHKGRNGRWYYADDYGVRNALHYPMTWPELWQLVRKSGIELHAIGAPFPPKTIEPEDMQDGKRYRAIFEGEYHAPVPGFESETYGAIDLLSAGELDDDQLRSATRIEEIGGEQ